MRKSPDEYSQTGLLVETTKPDRVPFDLLIDAMLRLGVPLSASIEKERIGGLDVYSVEDGFLLACFDKGVSEEVVEAIARRAPSYAVFSDAAMKDDATLANFDQIFETYSPATVRNIL